MIFEPEERIKQRQKKFNKASRDIVVASNNYVQASPPLKELKIEAYSRRIEMMFPEIFEKEKEYTIDRIMLSYWIAIDSYYE